ncbi:energy transducer TonB [Parabacteroides gordonii]|jgi:TonB family protein|uniref:energy transducer TonB n=1 Tax=Parabacteroides gordonii TaxID=574930 RepID=UPI0024203F7B|nr:energy transducer TonB [Parabacteroides gordonii]
MENYYLSLVCLSCLWLVSSCNLSTSRKPADVVPEDSVNQIVDREKATQEVPTRLLHKLGELYGDNPPGVVGFSVESKDCPDFIGGVYINDRDTLVIQIRGDSAAVRKQLEDVLDSKEFIVEPAGAYTQKELTVIQNKLSERWDALMDAPVMQNVVSTGVGINDIEIRLMLNTPEKRKEFREKVMDSPAFRFTGPEKATKNARVGVNDTRGISLRPEYTVYPTDAEKASFILYNNSGGTVYYGGDYTITYEDTDGVWREQPMDRIVLSLAYGVENGEHKPITAFLYPQVHANLPGRYRFFLDVTLGDLQAGIDVPLMAEFTLSDDKQELAHATKTPIPEYILQGMSEQEYLIQKERELEQELETKVFVVVEQMPEFPDGGQPGMLAFLENAISEEVRATGKEDRITLSFVVERDGSLSNIEILRSKGDKQLEDEAIRIIRKMPKWNPGKQRGKVVKVKYTIPITFRK